jgi:hypothetical protein
VSCGGQLLLGSPLGNSTAFLTEQPIGHQAISITFDISVDTLYMYQIYHSKLGDIVLIELSEFDRSRTYFEEKMDGYRDRWDNR